jgi:hypothetical protein
VDRKFKDAFAPYDVHVYSTGELKN